MMRWEKDQSCSETYLTISYLWLTFWNYGCMKYMHVVLVFTVQESLELGCEVCSNTGKVRDKSVKCVEELVGTAKMHLQRQLQLQVSARHDCF